MVPGLTSMIQRVLCLLLLLLPAQVFAAEVGMLYSKSSISILRKNLAPLPWQQDQQPVGVSSVDFNVEVRDASATLYSQQGWYNLTSLDDKNGVLMVFAISGINPLPPTSQYAPLDILFLDKNGTIMQIMPNITLANVHKNIMPDAPVLAFLFLNGGICKKLSIMPGDTVDYSIFSKPPEVQTLPQKSK